MLEEGLLYENSTLMFTLKPEDVERNVERAKQLEEMLSEGYVLVPKEGEEVKKVEIQAPWEWNPLWSAGPVDPADPNLVQVKWSEIPTLKEIS